MIGFIGKHECEGVTSVKKKFVEKTWIIPVIILICNKKSQVCF